MAELLGRAGIYLHTHGTDHGVTMPISIAEAMATGAVVLGRDLPGVREYIGRGGELYSGDTPAERAASAAAIIDATTHWTDEHVVSSLRRVGRSGVPAPRQRRCGRSHAAGMAAHVHAPPRTDR